MFLTMKTLVCVLQLDVLARTPAVGAGHQLLLCLASPHRGVLGHKEMPTHTHQEVGAKVGFGF